VRVPATRDWLSFALFVADHVALTLIVVIAVSFTTFAFPFSTSFNRFEVGSATLGFFVVVGFWSRLGIGFVIVVGLWGGLRSGLGIGLVVVRLWRGFVFWLDAKVLMRGVPSLASWDLDFLTLLLFETNEVTFAILIAVTIAFAQITLIMIRRTASFAFVQLRRIVVMMIGSRVRLGRLGLCRWFRRWFRCRLRLVVAAFVLFVVVVAVRNTKGYQSDGERKELHGVCLLGRE